MNTKRQYVRGRATGTAVNGAATATIAAPGVGRSLCVVGMSISASAAPAAAVSVQLLENSVEVERYELPAANFPPLHTNFTSPMLFNSNLPVALTVPALGAGVRGTVVLRFYIESD